MVRLRRLFFPPPDRQVPRVALIPLLILGLIFVVVLLALPPAWEYSNSVEFCGLTCHTMPPEYSTYLVSPHARVLCVDCHIGRNVIAVQAFRKAGHMRLLAATVLDTFEYPIRTSEMRPAMETCELCHFPEKFSDDSLRVIKSFQNDRDNSPISTYMLMHTGGGSAREGLARGIHWHVENPISYIAMDPEEQDIPWVRVESADGTIVEYNDINSPVDTNNLGQYQIHRMDCITCHNRISHLISPPDRSVDNAIDRGDISREIPFIRSRAVDLLSVNYSSNDEAFGAFSTLDQYYRDNYSDFYAVGADKVNQAVSVLERLYTESNYPEQLLAWNTHPDNIGHLNSPGCFRCHDGKHLSSDGQVIRLECNLCHSVPQVVRAGEIEPQLPLATGLEPSSHLTSTWISQHRNVFDTTCANCHTTGNPGGTDDSSFCSNSGCHGREWQYAGFNAPGLATVLGIYQGEPVPILEDFTGVPTYEILQPLFMQECGGCHGPRPSKGLRLTDYLSLLAGSSSGPVVVPGAPGQSKMLQVLKKGHFARLSDHQMGLLTQWIQGGAIER